MAARITAYLVALIVGTTFIAGLIVGAQRSADGPVDLIVVNGNVYTADLDNPTAEAVAVQGNKIVMVGSNRDVQRLRRPQTIVVDAKGGAVLPGFNAAQRDFPGSGMALQEVDLHNARSVPEIEARVHSWAKANVDRAWVTGRGWHDDTFPGGQPTRELLDAIVPDRPAFFMADDGRRGWANSAALKLAGITRRTPNPANGVIVKDPRSGEPTGVLKAAAIELVTGLLPRPTRQQRLAALGAAIEQAHRLGVTSIEDTSASPDDLSLYDELRRKDALDVRVYAALSVDADITAAELDTLGQLREKYADDPLFKTGAVRISVDADSDAPDPVLERLVADLDKRGWQVVIHAIGDHAVRLAVDAFAYVTSQDAVPPRDRRHRIEPVSGQSAVAGPEASGIGELSADLGQPPDVETLNAADVARIATVGVTAARLPKGADPLLGLQLAVRRAEPDSEPTPAWSKAERQALRQAIDVYTRDAAWASYDEHRKGTLKRDMLADIVVLSRDIFALSPLRLSDADVAVTIFNGKVVFSRPAETND